MFESMAIAGAVVASLAAFDALASRFGKDSRDGDDWFNHVSDR